MAVPFRKISKTRRDMRRTHYKVTANSLVKCPNCGEAMLTHTVCTACGQYKGKVVSRKDENFVETVEKKEEKKASKKSAKKAELVEEVKAEVVEEKVEAETVEEATEEVKSEEEKTEE